MLLLFDQAVSGRESAAKTKLTEMLVERAWRGEDRQGVLDDILAVVSDPDIDDEQVGPLLRERVGLERMRAAWGWPATRACAETGLGLRPVGAKIDVVPHL